MKRQEQEKKEEEVLGDGDCADGDPAVGDHGDSDHGDDVVTRSSKSFMVPPPQIFGPVGPLKERENCNKLNGSYCSKVKEKERVEAEGRMMHKEEESPVYLIVHGRKIKCSQM